MKKYESGDIATFYFVVNDDGKHKSIQGWTDDKNLVKFYMEFHHCDNFHLKAQTMSFDEMINVLNENTFDEIEIYYIAVKDPKKDGHREKRMAVPMTKTESTFVREECNSLFASMINYSFIDSAIPYMKKKYRDVLKNIFLTEAIKKVLHNQRSPLIESIPLDEMMILLYAFPDNFG